MNGLRHIPLLKLVVPMVPGILWADSVLANLLPALVLPASVIYLVYSGRRFHRNIPLFNGIVVIALAVCTGILLGKSSALPAIGSCIAEPGSSGTYVLSLAEEPRQSIKGVSFTGTIIYRQDSARNCKANVACFVQGKHDLHKGDQLIIKLRIDTIPESSLPFGYKRKEVLLLKGITHQTFSHAGDVIYKLKRERYSLAHLSSDLGRVYDQVFADSVSRGFMKALVLGDRKELDRNLRTAFASTGIIHVLAVSGLHVGILFMVLMYVTGLEKPGCRFKIPKVILVLAILFIYAGITGFSASVSRSVLMFSIVCLGFGLDRKGNILNSLSLAGLILLSINPGQLMDVGFQLSFSAVAGIVLMNSTLRKCLPAGGKLSGKACDLIAVSMAAQLGTVPLTLYYFQQFPNYFLLGNLLFLPYVPIILVLGFGILLASPFSLVLSKWMASFADLILQFLSEWVFAINGLPNAVSTGIQLDRAQVVLMYFLIATLILWIQNGKYIQLSAAVLLLFLLLAKTEIRGSEYYHLNWNGKQVGILVNGKKWHVIGDTETLFDEAFNNYLISAGSTYYGTRPLLVPDGISGTMLKKVIKASSVSHL